MKNLYVSILESLYLIYMFHFCKTSVDFNILASPQGWWFEHLIGNEKGLRICPFGQIAIFVLIFILIGRHYFKIPQYLINIFFIIAFLLSWMNLNAIVYILPVLVIEYVRL